MCDIKVFFGISIFICNLDALRYPEMQDFFAKIKNDFGKKKDDDQETAPMEEMDVKKIKEQSALKEIYKDVARAAHTHYFGNVLLPISTFKTPQKWAARDFNILHGRELCATWCTVGLLFPDKLAVVCVFDVSFVLTKMKSLRWPKKTLKLYDKTWKVECRSVSLL